MFPWRLHQRAEGALKGCGAPSDPAIYTSKRRGWRHKNFVIAQLQSCKSRSANCPAPWHRMCRSS